MNYITLLNNSFKTLNTNKIRTSLTMLGVIIGVASVISLMSIGKGLENFITQEFESIGSNLIFIAPGNRAIGGDPAQAFGNNKLDDKHDEILTQYASSVIERHTPYVTIGRTIKYKSNEYIGSIYAGNEYFPEIFNYELVEGRFFTSVEYNSAENVAVIGPGIQEELFPNQNAIGKEIKIGDSTFKIIGRFKDKGQSTYDNVVIPITTVRREFSVSNYTGFIAQALDESEIDRAIKVIERSLQRDLDEDEFNVLSQQDALDTLTNILSTLTIGLGAIAGISLLVGGIGIMNIMLVTVTERTKEIGLRKAVGATSNNIAIQFLIESILISAGGGLIGILIGILVEYIAKQYFPLEITSTAVILAFTVSAFVGIVFGTYPAIKASKKDPIESLRYE